MKIKFLSLILAASAVSFSCINAKKESPENNSGMFSNMLSNPGKGDIVEKTYKMDVAGIEVSTGLDAEVFRSNAGKIVVSSPSDLMDFIKIERHGSAVQIKIVAEGYKSISTDRIKIKIYTKNISELEANSSGSIVVKDDFGYDKLNVKSSSSGAVSGNFTGEKISIDASSSGRFSGIVTVKSLTATASSSGDIEVRGKSENANLEATSSGGIDAKDLIVDNAVMKASSSGTIVLGVTNSAIAASSSSGGITIVRKGSLNKIIKKESSSGMVTIK